MIKLRSYYWVRLEPIIVLPHFYKIYSVKMNENKINYYIMKTIMQ